LANFTYGALSHSKVLYYNDVGACGAILVIDDIDRCIQTIENLGDQDTLVVFDVDEVLVSIDRLYYFAGIIPNIDYESPFNKFKQCTEILGSHHSWTDEFQILRKKGARIIALTASQELDETVLLSKYNVLQDLKLEFDSTIREDYQILQEDRPKYYFYKGVLFSGTQPKGNVLLSFLTILKAHNIQFQKIVFIDNNAKNIKSVKNVLTNMNKSLLSTNPNIHTKQDITKFNKINLFCIHLIAFNGYLRKRLSQAFPPATKWKKINEEKLNSYLTLLEKYPQKSDDEILEMLNSIDATPSEIVYEP